MSDLLGLPLRVLEDILAFSDSLVVWTWVSRDLRQLILSSTGLKTRWLIYTYLRARSQFSPKETTWLDRNEQQSNGSEEASSNQRLVEDILDGGDSELALLYWRQYQSDYSFEEDLTTYGRWLRADPYHNHGFISNFYKCLPRNPAFLDEEVVKLLAKEHRYRYEEMFDSILLAAVRDNNPSTLSLILHDSPDPQVIKRFPLAYSIGVGAREVTLMMLKEFRVGYTMCHAIACIKEGDLETLECMIHRSPHKSDIWDGIFCGFMRAFGLGLARGSQQAIQLTLDTLVCPNSRISFGLDSWEMHPNARQSLKLEPWKSVLKQICLCACDVQIFDFTMDACARLSRVGRTVWCEEALLACSLFYPHHFTSTLVSHLLSTGVNPNASDGLALWNTGFNFTNGGYSEYERWTYGVLPIDQQEVTRKTYVQLAVILLKSGLLVTEKLLGKMVSAGFHKFLQTLLEEDQLPPLSHSRSLLGIALDARFSSNTMIRFLLDNGVAAEPSHFLLCVSKGQLDIVRMIYEHMQTIEETTLAQALEISVKRVHLEVVEFLLEKGVSIETLLHGFSVSYVATGSMVETQGVVRFHQDGIRVDFGESDWSTNNWQDYVFLKMMRMLGTTWVRIQGVKNVDIRISRQNTNERFTIRRT
ncbi:hypothetical protein K493DRAFT_313546, partial [Basidiobolus meristosporus CBS 931.73]